MARHANTGRSDKSHIGIRMRYLVLIALLASIFGARADAHPYTAELDQLATKNDLLGELIQRVNQPRDLEEMRVGLDWLKARSISGFGGSRITFSYAGNLFRVGITDTASLALLFGLLTSRIDAARCADPSAPTEKLHRWDQALGPLVQHFRSLPIGQQHELVLIAISMEDKFSSRGPDVWMCSGGLAFMNKFFQKHKNNPNPPAREVQDPSRIGRTIVLEDTDIKPDFVPDEQWKLSRQKIIANFAQQMVSVK